MANPHLLPPGNTTFGRLSAAASTLQTRSSMPVVHYPQSFTAEQLAAARSSRRLNAQDFPNFPQDTLSGLIPSETATLTLLFPLVRGLVPISQKLSGATQNLTSLGEENDALNEELGDLFSQIANLPLPQTPPSHQDLSVLQSAIRDLSHRVTAPAPLLPHVPAPTPQPQPPARPPPLGKGKNGPNHLTPPPPNQDEDPKYLIPYYDMKLGKAFSDPKRYAQLFPHSYEAGEFEEGPTT